MTLSLRMGGPLASVRAEAASLLQLLRDVAGQYGRNILLLIYIDCLVLLDILCKWGTYNFHPRPREVVRFDVIYPLLLELYQYIHTPFFSAKRQIFPCDLFRIDSYLLSGFWFSVGPTVRTYTMNVPTFKMFFLFG